MTRQHIYPTKNFRTEALRRRGGGEVDMQMGNVDFIITIGILILEV